MENKATTLDIVSLCLKLDLTARSTYDKFHLQSEDKNLKIFWKKMAAEEDAHIGFWKSLVNMASRSGLPDIFEDADSIAEELKTALTLAQDILEKAENEIPTGKTFLTAYRLEFCMLNPAFELLFHILGRSTGGLNPETEYISHISAFGEEIKKLGIMTPELELIGDTLAHIWKESTKMAKQTIIDELTSIYNRRGFMVVAEQLAALAKRNNSYTGMLLIDIDNFKQINEALGHQTGDRILKKIANIIKDSIRASDLVGRYGGEEFVVFLPEVRDRRAGLVAEKIRLAVKETRIEKTDITVSIGAIDSTIKDDPGKVIWDMVKHAESYLYAAKKGGRNMVMGSIG